MPKLKFKRKEKSALQERCEIEAYYRSKFFSLFMNSYKFPELDEQQQYFLLKRLWRDGKALFFILPDSEIAQEGGELVITPFAESKYNLYDFPTEVTAINLRGATFIPATPFEVNKNCVIMYAHSSHMAVCDIVEFYVKKIAEVELTINTNLFVHKLPRLVVVSPEDKERVQNLIEKIEEGEPKIFLDAEDYQAIKNVLDSGASYIIDKLYAYKQGLENELLSMLGIDNIGIEKKERLIVDEANSNNDLINDHSDCFLDTMEDACENVTKVLNHPLSVIAKSSPVTATIQGGEEDETK